MLRSQFSYDGISRYLFDAKDLNLSLEFYTHVLKSGKKTFYISGTKIIAMLEKRSDDNLLLTRFSSNCHPKEIIRFKTASAQTDDPISFQINVESCSQSSGGLRDLSDEKQLETKSFFNAPTEPQELRQ